MKRQHRFWFTGLVLTFGLALSSMADLRNKPSDEGKDPEPTAAAAEDVNAAPADSELELQKAQEAMKSMKSEDAAPEPVTAEKKKSTKKILKTEAFIAPPDWEFDGFVAGGQDEKVKSMFAIHDLLYLNIGSLQGLGSGDRVAIYKRGDRIRDSQSGKFIGFEVRRAAFAEVTDKVDENTAAVRITKVYEPVEVGDLVRKEQ